MNNDKKQVAKISIFITSIFVIFLSVTYAFINMIVTGTKRQVITSGNLAIVLEEKDAITLENAMPMHDDVGMIQDSFDFKLINKLDENATYQLKLIDITDSSREKLDTSIVKYGFTKDGATTIDLLSNLEKSVLDSGIILGNQTIEYSLRLWIDSGVENNQDIQEKSLRYRIDVESTQDVTVVEKGIGTLSDLAFLEENLGESCKVYDDGTDTFLVGKCSQNYVWYSGKLWRVVLKNNDTGAVKLITENAITSIMYGYGANSSLLSNSYVDQWLRQEFLPTLHDYEDYLVVDSVWNTSIDSSDTPIRPTGKTKISRTVGLLNRYEYYTTYNNSDKLATAYTGYLNNKTFWWLITPYDNLNVYDVGNDGVLYSSEAKTGRGVRPAINMLSEVQVVSGKGTIDDPYRLKGDSQEVINGTTLLSSRYSGEYVYFNNAPYRIIGLENNLLKITAVDAPSELYTKFSANLSTDFSSSSIRTTLEKYYQNLDDNLKSMVEPNTTWYLGTIGDEKLNYKAAICQTVDANISMSSCKKITTTVTANIGTIRVGEIFASHITRNQKSNVWTLTPVSTLTVNYISSSGLLGDQRPGGSSLNVRPSLYLKSNVVIAKNNDGDGTYEHPYSIEFPE